MFGMIQHGARGIEHLIGTPVEENVGEYSDYGIDWAVIDDRRLMEHHAQHNEDPPNPDNPFAPSGMPQNLSNVACDPPDSPLTPEQCSQLDASLAARFDTASRDMLVRCSIWAAALDMCIQMTQE